MARAGTPLWLSMASIMLLACGSSDPPVDERRAEVPGRATASPTAAPERVAAAQHFLGCADVGAGPTFVVSGPVENVGDVPLRLRAEARWRLRGRDLTAQRTFRVRPGERRRVRFSVPVSGDVVRRFESSGECSVGLRSIGREAYVTTAP